MISGSTVALVTPFDNNLKVDEVKLKQLIDFQIKNGTDCILVSGTTGESATLSHEEHRRVIEITVKHVNKRIKVMAGCGSNATHESLALLSFAQKIGADFALVITPYYNKPTQAGLYAHYKFLADNVKIPIFIYNVPGRTSVNILPETTAKLYKDCKNIVGIKEASGNIEQAVKVMSLTDKKFILLSGDDAATVPMMAVGAKGVISVLANIMPKEVSQMCKAYLSGDIKKGSELQLKLYKIATAMFIETNPIPVKTALSMMGKIDLNLRLPLCKLLEENEIKLKEVLREYKLIKEER